MFDTERLTIDHENPEVRQMLARQAMEAIRADIYASYLDAIDQHHGGLESGYEDAVELQKEKSEFVRSEYPLIPYFWLLHNDDGSIFQEMLELNKIDPDTGQHPIVIQNGRLNGRHVTDGRILVAIFNSASKEVWRNGYFNGQQTQLLFSHAREIETVARQ